MPVLYKNETLAVNKVRLIKSTMKLTAFAFFDLLLDDVGVFAISNINQRTLAALAAIITSETLFYAADDILSIVEVKMAPDNPQQNRIVLTNAGYAALTLATAIVPLFCFARLPLQALGYSTDIAETAQRYTRPFAIGIPAAFLNRVITNASYGIDVNLPTWLLDTSCVILGNIAGLALTNGWLGLPKLGIAGFGWAYAGQYWLSFLCLSLAAKHMAIYEPLHLSLLQRPNAAVYKDIMKKGARFGLYAFSETLCLTVMGILAIHFGDLQLQTAMATAITFSNLQSALLQGPFEGVGIQLSHQRHAIIPSTAKQQTIYRSNLMCALALAAISSITLSAFAPFFASILGSLADTNSPRIIHSATRAIYYTSAAQVFNAVRNVSSSALRSSSQDTWMIAASVIGLCIIGCGSSLAMAAMSVPVIDAIGIGLNVGIAFAAVTTTWRYATVVNASEKVAPLQGTSFNL